MGIKLLPSDSKRFDEVSKRMQKFPEELEEILDDFVKKAGQEAKSRAPEETGELKRKTKGVVRGTYKAVESNADHAGLVENGTRYTPPHKFFFPSIRKWRGVAQTNMRRALKKLTK